LDGEKFFLGKNMAVVVWVLPVSMLLGHEAHNVVLQQWAIGIGPSIIIGSNVRHGLLAISMEK
jgi:hypothetical protein